MQCRGPAQSAGALKKTKTQLQQNYPRFLSEISIAIKHTCNAVRLLKSRMMQRTGPTQSTGARHRAPGLDSESAGARHKDRGGPTQRAPGPDTQSAEHDTEGARFRHRAPGPDTDRRGPTQIGDLPNEEFASTTICLNVLIRKLFHHASLHIL